MWQQHSLREGVISGPVFDLFTHETGEREPLYVHRFTLRCGVIPVHPPNGIVVQSSAPIEGAESTKWHSGAVSSIHTVLHEFEVSGPDSDAWIARWNQHEQTKRSPKPRKRQRMTFIERPLSNRCPIDPPPARTVAIKTLHPNPPVRHETASQYIWSGRGWADVCMCECVNVRMNVLLQHSILRWVFGKSHARAAIAIQTKSIPIVWALIEWFTCGLAIAALNRYRLLHGSAASHPQQSETSPVVLPQKPPLALRCFDRWRRRR